MRIQYLNGGLANQMFQYIFSRYLELTHPEKPKVIFDDTFFYLNNVHNGYELEKVFGIKITTLKDCLDASAWHTILENRRNGISVCQSLLSGGIDICLMSETEDYKNGHFFNGRIIQTFCNEYHPEIADIDGDVYYYGFWINKNWFEKYKYILLNEFKFPELSNEHNKFLLNKIQTTNSVGVHIRRGDFLKLGWDLDFSYYYESVTNILNVYPDAEFFIFSDDLEWCQKHADELGFTLTSNFTFVTGNVNGLNYIDMQLMTQCEGLILSNSSFSYMAALLNQRLSYFINPVSFREI